MLLAFFFCMDASFNEMIIFLFYIVWKVFKYGVFSGPNTEKYGPEKTLYLDTFHAVLIEYSIRPIKKGRRVSISFWFFKIILHYLTYFMPLTSFDTPCFQRVSKEISDMKWVNRFLNRYFYSSRIEFHQLNFKV